MRGSAVSWIQSTYLAPKSVVWHFACTVQTLHRRCVCVCVCVWAGFNFFQTEEVSTAVKIMVYLMDVPGEGGAGYPIPGRNGGQ